MTANELIEALEKTGTGSGKIDRLRKVVEQDRGLDALSLVGHMRMQGTDQRRGGYPEGTVAKAERLAAGAKIEEFLGVPPPQSKEASEERMARMLGQELGKIMERLGEKTHNGVEAAQELSLGNPQKPSGSRKA